MIHVETEPEELERLEPVPAASAHREGGIVADIIDHARHRHSINLAVEGEVTTLSEGRATVQVSEPLCRCRVHAGSEPDKGDG